jgi:hypothetical protein
VNGMTGGAGGSGPGTGPEKTGPEKQGGFDIMLGLRLILLLIVMIAAVQLYFAVQGVISTWVAAEFIPLVSTAYYIVVIAGGIWLLRGALTGNR